MITYKVKNLITAAQEGEVNVIAHCCNCFCTMKSGIAPRVAEAFPGAYDADLRTVKGDKGKLGTISSWQSKENGLEVFNLYGQFGYWKRRKGEMDLDYAALRSALKAMNWQLKLEDSTYFMLTAKERKVVIGLPKIGAGLAGGDWSVISKIIEEELEFDVIIYVLKESEIPVGA